MTSAAKMTIETWPIDRPKPYPRNARKITQKAIDKVAQSLEEFGWQQPIVVDPYGVIIVGHTRLLAAKQLGMTQVPVLVAAHLSPAQVKAYRLMDNRSHEETAWDFEALGLELTELRLDGLDLELTGFEGLQLEKLLRPPASDEERAEQVPETTQTGPITQAGDVWLMGKHRLLCGDSTDPTAVKVLLADDRPNLMVTDPPYGVDYDPEWRLTTGLNKPWQTRAEGVVANDDRCDWSPAWSLFPGDVAYVWHGGAHAAVVHDSLVSAGLIIRSQIIWAKPSLVIGRGAYHWQHEPCWYAVRKGKKANWVGDRKQSTLWQVENMHRTQGNVDDGKTIHSTQKPIELMRRPILHHTKRGAAVYDPFLGSGTTVMACELTARACFGLELDPTYCDLIVRRWQAFTDKPAMLADCACTFAQVEAARTQGQAA